MPLQKRKLVVLTITGTVDRDVTLMNLKHFAQDALETWGGQFHPDDPLFESMKVRDINTILVGRVED